MSKVDILDFTDKATKSFTKTGYLNVWEGAVRSGKTVVSIAAFLYYVMNSVESRFLMSGNTIATLYTNVVDGDFGILNLTGKDYVRYGVDADGNRILTVQSPLYPEPKIIYCVGAHDEASYKKIRGRTIGGWYADEINLHPKTFIDEAFRRSFVSRDRKNFWTLNPDNPNHWIYVDYLDKYEREQLPGFHLWHFTLDDNKAITEDRKAEIKTQYSGFFYDRYVLGLRVVGTGRIYDMWKDEYLFDDTEAPLVGERYISMDYGTVNPMVFLDIVDNGDVIWIVDEYYWNSHTQNRQKEDMEYANDYTDFIQNKNVIMGILDPSAASLKTALRNRGCHIKDADNDVLEGIRWTSTLMARGKIRIHKRCINTRNELLSYIWDEKAAERGEEKPVKQSDHCMDALRYFVKTKISKWRVAG